MRAASDKLKKRTKASKHTQCTHFCIKRAVHIQHKNKNSVNMFGQCMYMKNVPSMYELTRKHSGVVLVHICL